MLEFRDINLISYCGSVPFGSLKPVFVEGLMYVIITAEEQFLHNQDVIYVGWNDSVTWNI